MLRTLLGLALLPGVVGACGGGNGDWEKAWNDARGEQVPEFVVSTYRGAEHCEWESAVFLQLGWPLGTAEKIGPGRQYVRDPEGLFPENVIVPLDLDARLPPDARYTGYHRGEVKLWVSDSEAADAVYLVRGEQVERWPRTTQTIACA